MHQKAFDDVMATVAKDLVLAYPDYSTKFEIYMDALSKQLGSVITQGNRSLAFLSRKLSTMQQKYRVTKLELLAIMETVKDFKACCGDKGCRSIQIIKSSFKMLSD